MKEILHCEGDKYWNRLPREVVNAPVLEVLKASLDKDFEQRGQVRDVYSHCGNWD